MAEDLATLIIGGASALFGAGAAWGALRHSMKTTLIEAATAKQQADEALGRIAVERERVTKAEGRVDGVIIELRHLQEKTGDMVTREVLSAETRAQTAELRRTISRAMPAARDLRQEDSEPPSQIPPMRARLPSRREP